MKLEVKRRDAVVASTQQASVEAQKKAVDAQREAVAANEDLRKLLATLRPLQEALGLKGLLPEDLPSSSKDPSGKAVVMITTTDLGDVLEKMSLSSTPAIYDFQGKEMKFTEKGNPTFKSKDVTWRNGKIDFTGTSLSLVIDSTGAVLESVTVIGGYGVSILDGRSLTMTECMVSSSAKNALELLGSGSLTASKVKIVDCTNAGVNMSGSSSLTASYLDVSNSKGCGIMLRESSKANFSDSSISGGNQFGIYMSGSSSMVGTRMVINGIKDYVIRIENDSKLSLTGCSMRKNSGKPGLLSGAASMVLLNCSIDGEVLNGGTGTVKITN